MQENSIKPYEPEAQKKPSLLYQRTQALIGPQAMERIKGKKVIVFGAGGVGGYAIEALARSGVGTVTTVDFDVIEESNLNRQIFATRQSIGREKADVAAVRLKSINETIQAKYATEKVTPENIRLFLIERYDYVIDAVDDVKAKLAIISYALEKGVPVISCMGTGNKLHPELLQVADISRTQGCPLARAVRKGLKEMGITEGVRVVYSEEAPVTEGISEDGKTVPASAVFVPATAGLLMAAEVFRELAEEKEPPQKEDGGR